MKKKLTVNTLALGNLKQRRKQYTIMIIGIILAMVFSSSVLFMTSAILDSRNELKDVRYDIVLIAKLLLIINYFNNT